MPQNCFVIKWHDLQIEMQITPFANFEYLKKKYRSFEGLVETFTSYRKLKDRTCGYGKW